VGRGKNRAARWYRSEINANLEKTSVPGEQIIYQEVVSDIQEQTIQEVSGANLEKTMTSEERAIQEASLENLEFTQVNGSRAMSGDDSSDDQEHTRNGNPDISADAKSDKSSSSNQTRTNTSGGTGTTTNIGISTNQTKFADDAFGTEPPESREATISTEIKGKGNQESTAANHLDDSDPGAQHGGDQLLPGMERVTALLCESYQFSNYLCQKLTKMLHDFQRRRTQWKMKRDKLCHG
jgi:hypothetical protein